VNAHVTITPLNEHAVLVTLGNVIDLRINALINALHQNLMAASFPGFVESVPAYASLAVFYNPVTVSNNKLAHKSAHEFVIKWIEGVLDGIDLVEEKNDKQVIEIPVLYNGEDLSFVGDLHKLSEEEVISIHTATIYRVFMIGFLPGFPYLGIVDKRIATSRKNSPRTAVPGGSVAIAGYQTGIYPQRSPGGWQLIGQTPVRIFDKNKTSPCLFEAGDKVRFYSIDQTEFEKHNEY
jgi:inhibitor of KinA